MTTDLCLLEWLSLHTVAKLPSNSGTIIILNAFFLLLLVKLLWFCCCRDSNHSQHKLNLNLNGFCFVVPEIIHVYTLICSGESWKFLGLGGAKLNWTLIKKSPVTLGFYFEMQIFNYNYQLTTWKIFQLDAKQAKRKVNGIIITKGWLF